MDLDETLCTQFDVRVECGTDVLRRIDWLTLEVRYVTARAVSCREGTEKLIQTHRQLNRWESGQMVSIQAPPH